MTGTDHSNGDAPTITAVAIANKPSMAVAINIFADDTCSGSKIALEVAGGECSTANTHAGLANAGLAIFRCINAMQADSLPFYPDRISINDRCSTLQGFNT